MHCYQHSDQQAIGICNSCQKAVCPDCAKDTGRGLACSDECAVEVDAINQIIDRSKQIYGIGKKSNIPSTGILFHVFFSLVFIGLGTYPLLDDRSPEWFPLIMGLGFLFFAILGYVRTRKLNLNC